MDNNTNYVNFIRKIYSLEKSESNHLALMEMLSIFEFSEMQGFNTDLSYDTMMALVGFYPKVMDEIANYSKRRRERWFKNADTINRLAAKMIDVLRLYGKRAKNHAKPANGRYDSQVINNWVWTDQYVIAGTTLLYMEVKSTDGIAKVPAYLGGRYIDRLGQGCLRIGKEQLKKVVISPGIRFVAAQPELIHASVLEFTRRVTEIEVPQDILGTTKIIFRLSKEQAERLEFISTCKTTDDGYLLPGHSMEYLFTNDDYSLPRVSLYKKKSSPDSYDIDHKLKYGDTFNELSYGPYTSLIMGDAGSAVSLYLKNMPKPLEDIDRISRLLVDNMSDKERCVIRKAIICNLYYILYYQDEGAALQMIIGVCLNYDVDTADVCYKGKKYDVFRAYNSIAPTGEDHAFMIADENGRFDYDEDAVNYFNIRHHYMRRFRLINILA